MATKIFINLPVKDLKKSNKFFSGLGFKFNEQFSNENATSMIIAEDITVMLLEESFFQSFIPNKAVSDAKKSAEVLICLSSDTREQVDEMVNLAVAGGGTASAFKQDHGWMYGHGFEDLDGHQWEVMYMDITAIPAS